MGSRGETEVKRITRSGMRIMMVKEDGTTMRAMKGMKITKTTLKMAKITGKTMRSGDSHSTGLFGVK